MAALRFLVDTNVVIAWEDPKVVPPAYAELASRAQVHSIGLYIDEACLEDVGRDTDVARREITLSKLKKFPLLSDVAHRAPALLESRFGPIHKDNDRRDVLMLDTLELGATDFLISEDIGLHKRAASAGLHRRVFTVREALGWIQRTFDPKEVRLPYVQSRKAHQISLSDSMFDSLREDYKGFDEWFAKCRREHRNCWVVDIDGQLAGIAIRKDENQQTARTSVQSDRVLKICTFKMKPEYQGEKFGEQLLKTILWFAQTNQYELVYLTVFPKHQFLLTLLMTFGFKHTYTMPNNEMVMEREMARSDPTQLEGLSAIEMDWAIYPRFYDGPAVDKFVVPIQPKFHSILFPEIAQALPLPLFPEEEFLVNSSVSDDRTPGNTIRKVYVSRSPTRKLKPGDVLLFYLSKSADLTRSQSATTVGIVEQTHLATSTEELFRLVGRRSVYPQDSLQAFCPSQKSPVLVIDFLLSGHLYPELALSVLLKTGAFNKTPPQSVKRITEPAYRALRGQTRLSFE